MEKRYTNCRPKLFIFLISLIVLFASCSKKNSSSASGQAIATLGLYEYQQGIYKRIFMPIASGGSVDLSSYAFVFDSGSTGLTLDADSIIPKSMITTTGITVPGDSVVVNGITITSKTGTIHYGDATSSTTEYGNLAYANFTLGLSGGTTINTGRIPFFLYYKILDQNGNKQAIHSADVFGVGSGVSYAFSSIASPLSYITSTNGAISGYKLATMNPNYFNTNGTLVPSLLTIGLVPSDLASSSGFVMHPLSYLGIGGYSDNIPATITYNGTTVSSAQILFDTGTPAVSIIEDPKATGVGALAANSTVTVTTNKGFTFNYTVSSSGNLTTVQNPNNTADTRSIFSLDFFINNEFLVDYKDHQIGLKNN